MAWRAIGDARDGFVVLDPATEVEALPPRKASIWSQGPAVRRGSRVLQQALATAAVVPPISGLDEFLTALRTPVAISELVADDEVGTEAVTWQLLDGLVRRGFAHVVPSARVDPAELDALRQAWRDSCPARRTLCLAVSAGISDELTRSAAAASTPPAVVLTCRGDADVVALAELATAYTLGAFAAHTIVVELPHEPTSRELRACLRRLGASARLHAGATLDPAIAHALVADHVPVILVCRAGSLAELAAIEQVARAAHATAVELELDWTQLGDDVAAISSRLDALTGELGDVSICGFPSDAEIAQEALYEPAAPSCELERLARAAHLRRRVDYLLELEGKIIWGQDPAAEELWVPLEDDLLPHRPELLGLGEGAIVVDVGGGFGRVARRLAPHVGATGAIVSVDKEPIISARARRFAAELGVRSIQFRVGLGQRLPLPDDSADAAVLEWGGEIHRDGLLGRCVAEMLRVVRPGKRLAITYRLCNILLERLTEPLAPYPQIYPAIRDAIRIAGLAVIAEKFWVIRPRLAGAPRAAFEERYLPRLVDDLRGRTLPAQPPSVDLVLTLLAEKVAHVGASAAGS